MDKSYVVFKCSLDGRESIICFDAEGMTEANNNLRWLGKMHADEKRFQLETDEFFEVLEITQTRGAELEEAINMICPREGKIMDSHVSEHDIAYNNVMLIDGDTVVTGSYKHSEHAGTRNGENLSLLQSESLARPLPGLPRIDSAGISR